MRSVVPTPELIERVMVRGPRAAEILASKPKCYDLWCMHRAKYVVINPRRGQSDSNPPELVVCGTHKNSAMDVWAYVEWSERLEEKRKEREKNASYAANLAMMLTDAKYNGGFLLAAATPITFSHDDHGNVTLSRDEAQRLLEAWS